MIRRIFVGLFVAICLLVFGALLFVSTFDLNLHKERIEQLVFERTGRVLSIDGAVEAQLVPWAGLILNDMTLANAPGFEPTPFARVRNSDVQLELLPLLAGNFRVRQVMLDGLELNLRVNDEGVANWEDLLNTTTVVETETSEDDVLQSVEAGAPLAAALSVGALDITDASIRWVDEKTQNDVELSQLNLTADAFQLGSPFEFSTAFNAGSRSAQASTEVAAAGALMIDLVGNSYALQGFDIKTSTRSQMLPIEVLDADLTGDLKINLKAKTVDLTGINAVVENVPFTGEIHGTGVFDTPSFFGDIASSEFSLIDVLKGWGVSAPPDLDVTTIDNARFAFSFQQTDDQILIKQLALSSGDTELSGDLQVSNLAQSPVTSGNLTSNEFNPAPWMSLFGWRAADPLVMQRGKLSVAVRQSGQILSLNELVFSVDDFALTGNVEVTDINSSSPPLVFELHGTRLDVERYLPVSEITESDASGQPSAVALPIAKLKALDVDGKFTVDELSIAGVTLTDLTLPLVVKDGNIEVTEATASLYDGALFHSASLDLNPEQPLLKWSSNISAVRSEALLSDYLKSESPISGTGILNIDVISRGVNPVQWLQAADGAVSLRFSDGVISGVNLAGVIRSAHAAFQGDPGTALENKHTDFTELSISGEINDGLLRSDDLSLKAPLLRVSGEGSVELDSGQVDFLAQVLVTDDTEGQGGADIDALNGLSLPVPISGPISDLSVDFTALLVKTLRTDFVSLFEKHQSDALKKQKEKLEAVVEQQKQQVETKVEGVQESVEVFLEENKEVVIDQVEEKREEIEESVKQGIEKLIEKGVSNLSDE